MSVSLIWLTDYRWLAISAVIAVITYYYWKWSRHSRYWADRKIASVTPLPLLGNGLPLFFKTRPEIEVEIYKKLGKIYGTYLFGEQLGLTIAEPELIKQIMVKDFHLFRNRRDTGRRHKIFSKNMFAARDDDWKRIRAIASPTFTSGKLRKMYPLINKCCNDFIDDLEERVGKQKKIELKQLMGNYTMDVIARCAFASQTNTYKDPNNQFTTRANKFFKVALWKIVILGVFAPFFKVFPKLGYFLRDPNDAMFFIDFVTNVMKHRRDNKEKHNDFLQLLMDVERTGEETREEGDSNEAHHVHEGDDELRADKEALSNVSEKKLTENEILAQCFLFFIAGFETTASTLSYCSYELALHPEIQEKLFEETQQIFDEKGDVNHEVLSKLPFLDAVISETLRNYPPLIRLEREASEEVVLGDSGLKIEKGVIAEIPVYAMHHDPENFPDPFAFRPERFLPENRDQIKPYTYLPFGVGPRNCIGMRFALLEAKLALAKLSQKFKFSRIDETDVPLIFNKGGFILQAKQLIVGIEKR